MSPRSATSGSPSFPTRGRRRSGSSSTSPPTPTRSTPGEVTRFVVRYAPTDKPVDDPSLVYAFNPDGHGYVWHCHILDHEDNEMMRPFRVQPAIADTERSYQQGRDY
ncbi:MAG TPA: multicopper oxidase domain-containing protein [Actinomycetes bacterium]|nr:multicopper oxidase domain-containing protein [Actinomycetes bacterium]